MQIYDILKKEHEEVKTLLSELIALSDDDEYRFVLVAEIKNALLPHARAEEATLYNTIRAVDADKSIVVHAFKEHMEAESLLRLLEVKDKINFDWKSTAKKLQEALEHHIGEEEGKIFTECRTIFSDAEAESIGDAFLKLKPSFVGEGVVKNAAEMVVNMLPPRLADSVRGLKT
ncbi:MAG: hemerythrin domain-containing protein [Bdellovibrionales bacterium]|nr:hemerythrin domain-containing protein [Bdellovibrionales bacterium]